MDFYIYEKMGLGSGATEVQSDFWTFSLIEDFMDI